METSLIDRLVAHGGQSFQTRGEQGPPRIWFYNGKDQSARTPGFWFTTSREHSVTPGAPWKDSARYRDRGDTTWECVKSLGVVPIYVRTQPMIESRDRMGKLVRQWLKQWPARDAQGKFPQGTRAYSEWLCQVDGIDYPVVWASKGMIGAAAGNILKFYMNRILQPLQAQVRAAAVQQGAPKDLVPGVPLYAFRLPIATALETVQGKLLPYYEANPHGGQAVTIPDLCLPVMGPDNQRTVIGLLKYQDRITPDMFMPFALSDDELAKCHDIAEQYAEWPSQRRADTEEAGEAEEETVYAGDPRARAGFASVAARSHVRVHPAAAAEMGYAQAAGAHGEGQTEDEIPFW